MEKSDIAQRESEVTNWLNNLRSGSMRESELQSLMIDRLNSVLKPFPPSDKDCEENLETSLVPLANELRKFAADSTRRIYTYEVMLELIEL